MSEVSIAISLPLDADGFLRRECPHCGRQFKQRNTLSDEESTEYGSLENDFCPYCHETADTWWTQEQINYAEQLLLEEVVAPELHRLKHEIESFNYRGNFVQIGVTLPQLPEATPLTEPNDMVRVDFPCHPEKPIKIVETWKQEIACVICGIQYPVDLVKALPEEEV